MKDKSYSEYLLKNYQSIKNRIEYIETILKSSELEKVSDTIEDLTYKREGDFFKGRSP